MLSGRSVGLKTSATPTSGVVVVPGLTWSQPSHDWPSGRRRWTTGAMSVSRYALKKATHLTSRPRIARPAAVALFHRYGLNHGGNAGDISNNNTNTTVPPAVSNKPAPKKNDAAWMTTIAAPRRLLRPSVRGRDARPEVLRERPLEGEDLVVKLGRRAAALVGRDRDEHPALRRRPRVQIVVHAGARHGEVAPRGERVLFFRVAHGRAVAADVEELVGLVDVDPELAAARVEERLIIRLLVDRVFEPIVVRVVRRGTRPAAVRAVGFQIRQARRVDEAEDVVEEHVGPPRREARVLGQRAVGVDRGPLVADVAAVAAVAAVEHDEVVAADFDAVRSRVVDAALDVLQVGRVGRFHDEVVVPEAENKELEADVGHLAHRRLVRVVRVVGGRVVVEDGVLGCPRREEPRRGVLHERRAHEVRRGVDAEDDRAEAREGRVGFQSNARLGGAREERLDGALVAARRAVLDGVHRVGPVVEPRARRAVRLIGFGEDRRPGRRAGRRRRRAVVAPVARHLAAVAQERARARVRRDLLGRHRVELERCAFCVGRAGLFCFVAPLRRRLRRAPPPELEAFGHERDAVVELVEHRRF
mmetsp:Transcript_17290/g.69524  ORF Transcript_17290/g.69524 Transcript_17290/m.69524 type:complete len:588 (+) Transcript_17290:523-2286(+)